MPKPFMTYEQQIQKLKDKHLVIEDEGFAKDIFHFMESLGLPKKEANTYTANGISLRS